MEKDKFEKERSGQEMKMQELPARENVVTEEISSALRDARLIPDCAERTLSVLFYKFQFEFERPSDTCSMIEDKESIQKDFETLKDQLEIEHLYDSSIKSTLSACSKCLTKGDFRKVYDGLRELLEQIRPVDMDLMLKYMSKNKKGEYCIRDKDVIILLGGTGNITYQDMRTYSWHRFIIWLLSF